MRVKGFLLMFLGLSWVMGAWAADHVKGNGHLTTKKITVSDYNEIKVDGVIDFNYTQSDDPSTVEVTVDENLHPYVQIEVKNRVLSIAFKGAKVDHYTKFIVTTHSKWLKAAKVSGNANLMINSKLTGDETTVKANANSLVQFKKPVRVGKLDLNVSGSANAVVESLEADKIECDIDGSGSITIRQGKAKEGNYNIMGNGDIHAFGLDVPELNCKITGSGSAEVHPTDNLKASVMGNGSIRYKGPTAVQQRILGKGTIEEVK